MQSGIDVKEALPKLLMAYELRPDRPIAIGALLIQCLILMCVNLNLYMRVHARRQGMQGICILILSCRSPCAGICSVLIIQNVRVGVCHAACVHACVYVCVFVCVFCTGKSGKAGTLIV